LFICLAKPPSSGARIVDAAVRCALTLGISRFSMNDVAQAADLSRGTVYNHFPNRDALLDAVVGRLADQFVAASEPEVRRRRTLAAQVGEAAVFIHRHAGDRQFTVAAPGEAEHVLAVLISTGAQRLVKAWVAFWDPFLEAAEARREVRAGLDRTEAGEWIVRSLLTFAIMPSVAVDLDDDRAVRRFVGDHVLRGLAP
jgi:AcrR family transcriptional regulator